MALKQLGTDAIVEVDDVSSITAGLGQQSGKVVIRLKGDPSLIETTGTIEEVLKHLHGDASKLIAEKAAHEQAEREKAEKAAHDEALKAAHK